MLRKSKKIKGQYCIYKKKKKNSMRMSERMQFKPVLLKAELYFTVCPVYPVATVFLSFGGNAINCCPTALIPPGWKEGE